MQIGVIGASKCSKEAEEIAFKVGQEIARHRAVLVCGGLTGVMEHAAKGAKSEGGLTVGILPGFNPQDANPYIDIKIVTGLSYARNIIIVRSSDALIAIEGGYGTLSEIAFALQAGKPIIGINTWKIDPIIVIKDPVDAVKKAIELSCKERKP